MGAIYRVPRFEIKEGDSETIPVTITASGKEGLESLCLQLEFIRDALKNSGAVAMAKSVDDAIDIVGLLHGRAREEGVDEVLLSGENEYSAHKPS
jgi:hypothetical protein